MLNCVSFEKQKDRWPLSAAVCKWSSHGQCFCCSWGKPKYWARPPNSSIHPTPRIWQILILAWYLKCSSESRFFLHPPYAIQTAEHYTLVCHPAVLARTSSSLTHIFSSFEVRVKECSKSIRGICGLIDIHEESHTEAKAFVYPRISLNNSTALNLNWPH